MGRPILTFADLLAPISPEIFLEQNWENQPLHIRRRESGFYEELVTHRDVEEAIVSGGLRYPSLQLARDGRFFAAESFTRSIRSGDDVFSGIPNLDRIGAEYRSGATISLPGFHRAWRPLGALAAAVEEQLDHVVHTNVYITPGNAAGFSAHYDTHEVFVLQIAGSKRWRIEKPPLSLPHRGQPFDPRSHRSSAAPLLQVDLAPGDLLYLPRGFVHETTTSDSFSLHVTLGVTVYTWLELLAEWIQSGRHNPSLRRALPPGFTRGNAKQLLDDQLPLIIAELQRVTDYGRLVDGFAHRVRSARAGAPVDFSTNVLATNRTRSR